MRFFRFKKRRFISRRSPLVRQRWDMRPKRSRYLKIQQLLKGKFLIGVGVFLAIGIGLYLIFFTSVFSVRAVEVSSAYKDINLEKLKKSVEDLVLGKNLLLVSQHDVTRAIYDSFPDVSSLKCHRNPFPRSFNCEAIGFELVAVMKHETQRYYINENGVVISYDSRKLGLPFFDLILNPVFAEIKKRDEPVQETVAPVDVIQPVQPAQPASSLTASILSDRENGLPATPAPVVATDLDIPDTSLVFIQPNQAPPVEPLILEPERRVFEVTVGQKILDPKELQTILHSIQRLEEVLGRKVIEVQYVQVAGELSLRSKPAPKAVDDAGNGEDSGNGGKSEDSENGENTVEDASDEDPEHEFMILLDLKRDLEDQFVKLSKSKEVIDFSQVSRIDLSIDGEKVFYR